jgi:CheY-like chemotaxis protein
LHVDDNDDEAALLQAALRSAHLDLCVRHVPSGDDAIAYFQQYAGTDLFPHLVLLDLNMPRMSGFEVLAWIRQRFRDLPVIIHTSSDVPDDLARARALGATLYLVKSLSNNDLIACLKKLKDTLGAAGDQSTVMHAPVPVPAGIWPVFGRE